MTPAPASTGLVVFTALCNCANTLVCCREAYPPGSDTWAALTWLVQDLDGLLAAVVYGPALEDTP